MPRSVLVVDADREVALGLTDLFEGEGYAVRYALDGLDALRQLREHPPDLLVSDVVLPGMSGVSLARRARRTGGAAVILTSGYYADVDIPGMRFVRKPIDLDALLCLVRRALGDAGPCPRPEATRPRELGRAGAGSGLPRPRGRPNRTVYK